MTEPRPTTRAESREAIRQALIAWKKDGVTNPVLPVYTDLDGDGVPDFFGLDENEQVVTVSGVTVLDTVALSLGTGIEQGGGS
ncbi:hypothetical protein QE418_003372 [Microbacterium testaceum]|uniref:hypothetical protein n=1 Tax=Microbacterium TaxID=33882 RepID=UPI002789B0D3|nr:MULTISPECIES: hypothetical protein [Microbacterium]MDQ1113924.1 hypothetical protein [Microbacterium testaceum]MDR6098969.1 hypothetical protein [Microbacterium sp. SORGH_AS_0454]